MEKMLIKNHEDEEKAIKFFGRKYSTAIRAKTKILPCVLIGHYSEDIEFGAGYSFTSVTEIEFKNNKCESYF